MGQICHSDTAPAANSPPSIPSNNGVRSQQWRQVCHSDTASAANSSPKFSIDLQVNARRRYLYQGRQWPFWGPFGCVYLLRRNDLVTGSI